MHALATHNVKEFSRTLMKEPAARPTPAEVAQDEAEQFVLYDKWFAAKVEAPPDWVLAGHLKHARGR